MKRFTLILLAVLLVMMPLALAACKDSEDAPSTTDIHPIPVVGGWSLNSALAGSMTEAQSAAFDAATEGMDGALYRPLACFAEKTVTGFNYAYIAMADKITAEGTTSSLAVLLVSAPVDGTPSIYAASSFDIGQALTDKGSYRIEEGLMGGWIPCLENDLTEMPENMATFLSTATGSMTGTQFTPIACLGSKIVNGSVYAFLAWEKNVTPDASTSLGLFTVLVPPDGSDPLIQDTVCLNFDALTAQAP